MNFTKINHPNKPWLNITTDFDKVSSAPLFVLAGRYKTYKLIIRHPDSSNTKAIFLIEGDKQKNEKAIIIFEINSAYNMVEKVTLQRSIKWDGELCFLLKKALIVRFIDLETYYFSSKVLNELT